MSTFAHVTPGTFAPLLADARQHDLRLAAEARRRTRQPRRRLGDSSAYSTSALIRSKVVRMPSRLVRPLAQPSTAQ